VFELFADVDENSWYAQAVQFVSDRGMFNGTGNGFFSPQVHMTRSMFVTILGRLTGVNESQFNRSNFDDVNAITWYAPFVAWATENGIVSGYGNGLFGPNDDISREQIALLLYKYAKYSGYDVSIGSGSLDVLNGFSDADSVSSWATDAANWAASAGLINGKPGNIFDPKGIATRAEVAAIMQRFITKITLYTS